MQKHNDIIDNSRGGYVALLTILMVTAIAASTVLIMFTNSVNQVQNVADVEKGLTALAAANACAERAMEYKRRNGNPDDLKNIPYTIGEGECEIKTVSTSGDTYTVHTKGTMTDATGTVNKYVHIIFEAPTDTPLTLTSWEEHASE